MGGILLVEDVEQFFPLAFSVLAIVVRFWTTSSGRTRRMMNVNRSSHYFIACLHLEVRPYKICAILLLLQYRFSDDLLL